jgi:hypothetical protein
MINLLADAKNAELETVTEPPCLLHNHPFDV